MIAHSNRVVRRDGAGQLMLIPIGINKSFTRVPVMCISIMVICTILQVMQTLSPDPQAQTITWGYIPGYGSLFTLFSHMFIHGGWWHLVGNMLIFYLTGFKLEDALGHWKFIIFYLAGGVAANGLHVLFAQDVPIPCVGASGAIAAAMGGFLILYPHSKIRFFYWVSRFVGTFDVPAWLYLGFWFAREVFHFVYMSGPGSGVAFGAHVGGFAAGMIWMWAFCGWDRGLQMEEEDGGEGHESDDAEVAY